MIYRALIEDSGLGVHVFFSMPAGSMEEDLRLFALSVAKTIGVRDGAVSNIISRARLESRFYDEIFCNKVPVFRDASLVAVGTGVGGFVEFVDDVVLLLMGRDRLDVLDLLRKRDVYKSLAAEFI